MKARRLQELGCRFEISEARFERPMMKDTWQLLNVFIMVCSWDLIMVGFTEKFWAWKPESDGGNRFSFVAVIDGPANVCGTGTFVFTGASGATGNPGSVIVPQYGSSKITVFVWGKNIILKFLGNTK